MTARMLVDTNILLRILTGEPALQAQAAKQLFVRAAAGEVILDITPIVVAETWYTLQSYYEVGRQEAAEKLLWLIKLPGVKVRDSANVFDALGRLLSASVGFADAYLAAMTAGEAVPVASFDRDFDKFKDVKRFEPVIQK
jgi:predicted nucleic acid-binding protein